jgi:hypothetical protein
MTDRPWTPGPWKYRPNEFDDWGVVRAGPYHLCQVKDPRVSHDDFHVFRNIGKDPWEANARLASAAPEMAEALIQMIADMKGYYCTMGFDLHNFGNIVENEDGTQAPCDCEDHGRWKSIFVTLEKAGWKP